MRINLVLMFFIALDAFAFCDIPNVYEFCSALMSDRQSSCDKSQCQGFPGKRGAPGRRGFKGDVGPVGPEGTCASLEQQVNQLKDEITTFKSALPSEMKIEYCGMGMKSRKIPDSAITVSDDYLSHQHGQYGRLDEMPASNPTSYGAWIPRSPNVGDWIQADFGSPKPILGIVTQGRPDYKQWVTSYKVTCGNEITEMTTITENGQEKVFQGNSDRNTKVINLFPTKVTCRYIRLYPQTWYSHLSMRWEILRGDCFDMLQA